MEENKQMIQGWRDVQLSPEMNVNMLINFLNILNQRLATIEDLVKIPDSDGKMISITEYYNRETQAELEAQKNKKEGE